MPIPPSRFLAPGLASSTASIALFTAANPVAASAAATIGTRALDCTAPSELTNPAATFVPPMSTPSTTDLDMALPDFCSYPMACCGEDENGQHQNRDAGAHNAQWLLSGIPPLAGDNPPDAGSDYNQRHEQWPAQDRTEVAQLHDSRSVHHCAPKPDHRHRRCHDPVCACASDGESVARLVLSHQIHAIHEVGNTAGPHQGKPDGVWRPERRGLRATGGIDQGGPECHPKIHQCRAQARDETKE